MQHKSYTVSGSKNIPVQTTITSIIMMMTPPTTPTVVATMTTSGMTADPLARETALVGRGDCGGR